MDGEVSVESMYGEGSTFKASIKQEVVDASPLDKVLRKKIPLFLIIVSEKSRFKIQEYFL